MKLAVLAVLAGLLVPTIASADVLNPPGGPVDDSDAAPVYVNNDGQRQRPPRADGQRRQRDPRVAANRARLRASLLAEFDVNGDGKLGPRERMRAVRMLRRIEQKLAQPMVRGQRDRQWRGFMNRYDVNRDGQVGPREVPRGAADKLRRFDRNNDGWVERNEVP